MEELKKYYVGARHIGQAIVDGHNASCTRHTMDAAIEEARQKVRNGEVDCAVVVQIVAVVRKDYPPVTVEILK